MMNEKTTTAFHEAGHVARVLRFLAYGLEWFRLTNSGAWGGEAKIRPETLAPHSKTQIALAGLLSEALAIARDMFGSDTLLDTQPELADVICDLRTGKITVEQDARNYSMISIRVATASGPRVVVGAVSPDDLDQIDPSNTLSPKELKSDIDLSISELVKFFNSANHWAIVELAAEMLSNTEVGQKIQEFDLWIQAVRKGLIY